MGLFSFITAPFATVGTAIGSVLTAGKRKATAKIMAADAAKQRAHESRMAAIAQTQSATKAKSTQTMLMIGGGVALVALIFLMKKR